VEPSLRAHGEADNLRRGRRLAPEAIREEYAGAPNVQILPDPQWSPENILAALLPRPA
jgi:hypothetical protein